MQVEQYILLDQCSMFPFIICILYHMQHLRLGQEGARIHYLINDSLLGGRQLDKDDLLKCTLIVVILF